MHICTVLRQGNEAKVYAASLGSMLSAYALLKRSRNGGRERGPGRGAGNGSRGRGGLDFERAISARGAH